MSKEPTILIFDSGLGGLTVYREVAQLRPSARYIYVADDAVFPYGRLDPDDLIARVARVIESMIFAYRPDVVVIACNTASTLVLADLRAAFPDTPFVGTVPAIKPAAEQSRSHLISVLATPGTVARDYTRDLIRDYATHCDVTLVGSEGLASIAEAFMHGEAVDDIAIAQEIAPCFVEKDGRRTDHIVLACTHYPLLREQFERLAPWEVDFVDPAPAIARRVDHVLREAGFDADHHSGAQQGAAVFTSATKPKAALAHLLTKYHLQIERPPVQLSPWGGSQD